MIYAMTFPMLVTRSVVVSADSPEAAMSAILAEGIAATGLVAHMDTPVCFFSKPGETGVHYGWAAIDQKPVTETAPKGTVIQ